MIEAQRADEARHAPLPTRRVFPSLAWHASDRVRREASTPGDIASTLDAGLQSQLESLAEDLVRPLGDEVQVSVLVVDVETRAVRAMVGSANRARPGGWIDLTDRPRSPGSTLKPFIYGLAFDDGIAAPDTHIQDLPRRFASYRPENFDRGYSGDVRIRDALQHSLNIPAVLTLDRIGPERFASALELSGVNPRVSGGALREAGLALALGGVGLTVEDLAMLYAALGDGGRVKPLVWTDKEIDQALVRPGQRFLSPESAREIVEILAKSPAPDGRMPSHLTRDAPEIAFKTGTSYGFRDAWAAGVGRGLAVVVWVGRADGAPRPGETGRDAALPLLFEIFDRASSSLDLSGSAEQRLVDVGRVSTGPGRDRFEGSEGPPEILFPPDGSELWAARSGSPELRSFVLSGRGDGRLNWYVNEQPVSLDDGGAPLWKPDAPGFYRIVAVDSAGRAASVRVRILSEIVAEMPL